MVGPTGSPQDKKAVWSLAGKEVRSDRKIGDQLLNHSIGGEIKMVGSIAQAIAEQESYASIDGWVNWLDVERASASCASMDVELGTIGL